MWCLQLKKETGGAGLDKVGMAVCYEAMNRSIFAAYPKLIVYNEYKKGDKRKSDFVRAFPEVVIVDEGEVIEVSPYLPC